jgi:hypothetical protein
VEGQVLSWQEDWIHQLEQTFTCVPKATEQVLPHLFKAMINAAAVRYLFVADELQCGGQQFDGVAYEFKSESKFDLVCFALSNPKWIGLEVSLLTNWRDETEPFIHVPLLDACLLEEIAHVWDYRLEEAGSPYSSAGVEWLKVECDKKGNPKPFKIPNRKPYDLIVEDWASAVIWYVFKRDELARRSPDRCEFVERLFKECLPL